ncbi:septin-14-like isoform X1 [Chlorocebus sabaeus]|uniref:septin-14-like isoform X1 n=1 Tax=Chlorocebus sabaeus TaxID=60711 RepID=UPI003BF9FA1B
MLRAVPPGSCSPSALTMWSWRRSGTTGPLRPGTLDEVLRCACLQVNIVPLITKADTISKNDLQMFKSKIMSELISNGIQIYQLPTDEETAAQANSSINVLLPFAVVGSIDEVKVAERMVRGRHYPWGVLQGNSVLFSIETVLIDIPTNGIQGFLFLHILTSICYCLSFG